MNNRLDYINNIAPEGLELMTMARQAYINLDEVIRHFSENPENKLDAASSRTLALSRTYLETSLLYAIKTLYLQYEKKPE